MKQLLDSVTTFQMAFKQEVAPRPTLIDSKRARLRYELMKEENEEYLEAVKNNDLLEVADALGDKLYILCGTILEHGLQDVIEAVFNEIHRSNLSKLDAEGKPIINGQNGILDESRALNKVLKSANYSEPNLKQILGFEN